MSFELLDVKPGSKGKGDFWSLRRTQEDENLDHRVCGTTSAKQCRDDDGKECQNTKCSRQRLAVKTTAKSAKRTEADCEEEGEEH